MRSLVVLGLIAIGGCRFAPSELGTDGPHGECGNLIVEPGEDCDDGDQLADEICDASCRFTCGNGNLDRAFGEICDPGITAGDPGACPTSCEDGIACTSDVLSGSGCSAMCVHAEITGTQNGDGCCPAGATANTDSDCSATCGNGTVESGESCDTAIQSGAGKCPTSCNDQQACTTDTLIGAGGCQAACSSTPITQAINGDGCCPSGATSLTDSDCMTSCGNGMLDSGETCDTAIASGAGSCPTSCMDNAACTSNVLSNPGTCKATCVFPPITMAINGDGCCPPGANATNDNDCVPVCGNGVREGSEQCDDGNSINTDACSNTCQLKPTAFRFNDLALRDPHTFISFMGCRDTTDGAPSSNSAFRQQLTTDGNGDGQLDWSPTLVFRPLDQSNTASTVLDVYFASCTAPILSTSCKPGAAAPIVLSATSQSAGTCLAPLAGTTHPYTPAITNAAASCFVSTTPAAALTITLAGIMIPLHDVQIAATYSGAPATQVVNGLLMGFLRQADADAIDIGMGAKLSALFPGGSGNCAGYSDKDTDNGTAGWWMYLNFTAPQVPWSEN